MTTAAPFMEISISADYPTEPNALRDVRLHVEPGEILGLAGPSGSGKSTLALAILRLLSFRGGAVRGSILWRGRDLNSLPNKDLRRIRGNEIAYMPQSPTDSLNPMLRIESQLWEAWRAHEDAGRGRWLRRVQELMSAVGLPNDASFLRRRPRQLSVGQAQRVLIAMALLHRPALLVADEPTSALDVISRAEILQLLQRLNAQTGMSLLFISHDLVAAAEICGRVAVIRGGEIIESASTRELFCNPKHAYTRRLIAATPGGLDFLRGMGVPAA